MLLIIVFKTLKIKFIFFNFYFLLKITHFLLTLLKITNPLCLKCFNLFYIKGCFYQRGGFYLLSFKIQTLKFFNFYTHFK